MAIRQMTRHLGETHAEQVRATQGGLQEHISSSRAMEGLQYRTSNGLSPMHRQEASAQGEGAMMSQGLVLKEEGAAKKRIG